MAVAELYAVQGSEAVPLPCEQSGVHEALVDAPPGVYSALRTYQGVRFLALDAHFERCRRSLEWAGWDVPVDFVGLRQVIDRVVRNNPKGDLRLRFDMLQHPVMHDGSRFHVLLAAAPHEPVPEKVLREGAHLALAPSGLKRSSPRIKFTRWVRERAVCSRLHPDADEHLLVDEQGSVLEGISSNFFAIAGGSLITSSDAVLEGITRRIVIELAERLGMPLRRMRLPLSELGSCEEACITSATREVVPVSSVGDTRIGDGTPGPLVRALAEEYGKYARQHATPALPVDCRKW